jgi:GntR family transcriptional repressor for pyruvate dehydrogenase complex
MSNGPQDDNAYEGVIEIIDKRGLPTDARLPGELELSRLLGVSRPILRQALARLRSEGRLYSRRGLGNFVGSRVGVSPLSFGPFSRREDIQKFMEFRIILEGEAAALAARSADAEAVALVTQRRHQLDARLALHEPAVEEDIAFHKAIAAATGNPYFEMTMAACMEQIRVSIRLIKGNLNHPAAARADYLSAEHLQIDDAIRSGDAAASRTAMVKHLRRGMVRLFGG